MRKVALAACVSLAALTGAAALAPAVAAAKSTPGCVTSGEYKKAKRGMTSKQISKLFGTGGAREARASSGGYVSEVRSYRACRKYSVVTIAFDKKPGGALRLSAKHAVWMD